MNWMTSGRHRALRTKRGKKRSEMHFPAHVQREVARVRRHPLARTAGAETRNSDGTAWYIRSVMDDNESHDIQMLERAREAATGAMPSREKDKDAVCRQGEAAFPEEKDAVEPPAVEKAESKKAGERRCVFTPVKANRSRPRAVEQVNPRALKRPLSPPPRDLLLFNEGEQLARPVSSRPPPVVQLSGQDRQTDSSKVVTSRFDEDSGHHQSKKRFHEPAAPRESLHGVASSMPFYAASSSSDDEIPKITNRRRGSDDRQATRHVWDDSEWGRVPNQQLPQHEPLQDRMNLFESIEQDIQSTRVRVARAPHGPGDTAAFDRHPVRGSQPCSDAPSRDLKYFRDLQGESVRLNFIQSASSMRRDAEGDDFRESGHLRCSSSNPTHLSEQQPQSASPRDHEYVASKCDESTSSQESLDLPPPVDWHKRLVARVVEEDAKREVGTSGSRKQDSILSEHLESIGSSPKWMISSRTRTIFDKMTAEMESDKECEPVAVDEIVDLQQRLHEKDAVALYLFTLVQCHRIDERFRSITTTASTDEEILGLASQTNSRS